MSGWKKLAGAAAASADVVNAENLFSTYVYRGTGSAKTITNNIDLSTYGGMVWIKNRDSSSNHVVTDTERNWPYHLVPNSNIAEETSVQNVTGFTTSGFTLGTNSLVNNNGTDFVSWTFRNQEKFFTQVKYTGDGTSSRSISHDLNEKVGCIMIKCISTNQPWIVYHQGVGATKYLSLDSTSQASTSSSHFNNTAPTTTHFTVGNNDHVNESGRDYMAYIFAHNNQGSGGFGSTEDQDIIKCSTFNASYSGDVFVDLTFEPQWILTKKMNSSGPWHIVDAQRLWATGHDGVGQNEAKASILTANTTASEFDGDIHEPWNRGFIRRDHHQYTDGGEKYIYIAIRRGLMGVPENASDVFAVSKTRLNLNNNDDRHSFYAGWPVDTAILKSPRNIQTSVFLADRIRPYEFKIDENASPRTEDTYAYPFDKMEGFWEYGGTQQDDSHFAAWRRAPQFYEVATWDGNSSAGRQITHTLGVVPEMMWVKNRDSNTDWAVYHKDVGNTKYLTLNRYYAAQTATNYWNNTSPTSSVFTLGNSGVVNYSNDGYIGYFFASLDGISKIGSYSGSSSAVNITVGFTPRWIMIKRVDDVGNWGVWDTARGINAGTEGFISYNLDSAESTSLDVLDTYPNGFTVNPVGTYFNTAGGTFIYYAIA